MSASLNWTAWNSAIGLPNCRRSFAYAYARSYAPCASPTPIAATEIRPPSRISRNCVKPSPARAEQVPLRHGAVLERELARVGRVPAELLHRRRDPVAGRAVRDDQVRDLVVAGQRGDRDEDVFLLLTADCGWSRQRFENWLTTLLRHQLVEPEPTTTPADGTVDYSYSRLENLPSADPPTANGGRQQHPPLLSGAAAPRTRSER